MIRTLFAFALYLILAGTVLAGEQDSNAQAVRDALAAGRPVVLSLISKFPSPEDESEAYADWAHYLNEFAAEHRNYDIVAMERPEFEQLLAAPPPLDNGYATIFVRSDGDSVVYDGAILEPFVYDAGVAFLDAPSGSSYDAELFAQYNLRLR